MSKRLLTITLILGWIVSFAACGGADSPPDPAGGSSGNNNDAGVSGDEGTRTVPAVKGPDGEWVCTQGLLLKSEPPECMIQGSTLADSGDDTPPDETSDAADNETSDSMPPDAGSACPSHAEWILDGQLVQCSGHDQCLLNFNEDDCSWSCIRYEGEPEPAIDRWSARLISNRCSPVVQ